LTERHKLTDCFDWKWNCCVVLVHFCSLVGWCDISASRKKNLTLDFIK